MSGADDLPALSIRRPLLVLVANLLIAIAGFAAIFAVEVRELPDVDRPIVSVRVQYPGASPETMDAEVTSVIEGAVARVTGVKSIESSSEENNGRIRVEFSPSFDLDTAASDVREAVSRVERELPDDVEQLTVVKADENADPIIRIAAVSDVLVREELTRVVENDIVPALIAVEGVADVRLFGDRERLLRVVVDPMRLTSYGLSVADLAETLETAPFDVPTGSFRSDDQELIVRADASVIAAEQVENIIIRGTTRIGDVAQVFFGPEDATSYVRFRDQTVIGLGIVRQAQSNTIQISDGVERALEKLNARFDTLELVKTSDDATFIRGSVREVLTSLALTIMIVVATIWVFIGSLRATLVPAAAIPISLIGTVAAIWLLGFSINILTLLALVLATGMIVDDAIVVLENIQRRRAQGLAARAAAVLGTRQVFFAVVATTAVLVSVFLPISFLPSTAGRLFREFGFVLAIAVMISSFVALSLVPSLSARIPDEEPGDHKVRRFFSRWGGFFAGRYESSLALALAHPWRAFGIALLAAVLSGALYSALDQELLPDEDRGIFYVFATGPDGVGLNYTERQAAQIEAILQPYVESGEIASLFTIVGIYDFNRAFVVARLAPWEERERRQQEIVSEIRGPLSQIPGARAFVQTPNSLNLRDDGGGLEVALIGNDYLEIYEAAKKLSLAIEERHPGLTDPDISYQPTQPQLSLIVDRRRASDLGIPLTDLAATLRVMVDGDEIADLNVGDEAIPIFLESASGAINDPSDLANLYVGTRSGGLVPISSVVSLKEEGVAAELDRHMQSRAVEIDAELAEGTTLSEAVAQLEELADEVLSPGVSMILMGEAATLEETSQEVLLTYVIAFVVVFLVLIAQFESLTSAAVVMVTVPFGIAAAILALFLTGTSLNVYSQIGLVMLIGLMAKNGILLVEFADQLRDRGYGVKEAIATSARVRLRPVAMTMISTVLGGLPLILSDGAGAESRWAIGWVIFGGLGLAGIFTLYLTPVVYLGIAPFSSARAAEASRLDEELRHAERIPDDTDGTPA
ncbi:efflux RND transporter permease subunit [Tepidicaulis sp.]|uniref:efflux RND transporter permease subunit n=1 Tax=Tepidicaulis sp. TaxID=1920809 RepID=UPI003B5A9A09